MKLKLAITLCGLWFALITDAQQSLEPCRTDHYLKELLNKDPSAIQRLQGLEKNIAEYQNSSAAQRDDRSIVVTIPVVFHVIHSGQPLGTGVNILDTQLISQLEVLNTCFRKKNSDAALIPTWFRSRAADFQVEFCLAKYDASGNPTSGINRYDFTNINNTTYIDNTIKPATQWDPDKYLNIWTTELPSPLLGYATFPCLFPKNQDGVVLDYRTVGKAPVNPFPGSKNLGKTGVHEVGHWLGLYHNFQDSCAGGTPQTCGSAGDYVCDTPPEKEATYGKPNLVQNSCAETPVDEYDMWMNYMDYPDDDQVVMFTYGQRDRAKAVLNNCRLALQSSLGCTNVLNTFAYAGQVVDEQTSAGVPNAKVLFDGPTPFEVAADAGGNFSIPNLVEGWYDVYAGAWGYRTKLDTIHAYFKSGTAPRTIRIKGHHYYDDFLMDFNWNKSNTAASGFWVRENPVGTFYGGGPANPTADLQNDFGLRAYMTGNGVGNPLTDGVTNGTVSLISPSFDVSGFTEPCIRYSRWYYNGGASPSGDNMLVRLSDGTNTVTLETIDTSQRPTNSWTEKVFKIRDFMTPNNNMRVFFVVNDVLGSNQNIVEGGLDRFEVLEEIRISIDKEIRKGSLLNVSLYPNPSNGLVKVDYALEKSEEVWIRAYNLIGEEIFSQQIPATKEGNRDLDFSGYSSGLYFITVRTANSEKILKFSLVR